MRLPKTFPIFATISILAIPVSLGEEMELREWKSSQGTSIMARLESFPDGVLKTSEIILTTADGRKIMLPFTKLSETDQEWISARAGANNQASVPKPGTDIPMDASQKNFDILTEKDAADASKLLFSSPGGFNENRFGIMAHPDTYRRFELDKYSDYLVIAHHWFREGHLYRASKKSGWVDAVNDAFQSDTGWWNPYPEKSANDLLRILTQNNRKRDGIVALKRVAYRTGIEPTKKELELINGSLAYAELTASLVVAGKIKERIPLVVVGMRSNDLLFIHGFTTYVGKLQRVESGMADALGEDRNDGMQIAEVIPWNNGSNPFEPTLASTLKSPESGILIGEKYGKMMTLSPEFLPITP